MKMNRLILLAGLTASAAFLPGCTTTNTVENAQPVAQRQMMSDKRVTTDASLNRRVAILGVNTADTPAGFLRIQVQIQNTTRSVQAFTYRIEWFDENGMAISLPTNVSMPKTLEGKETSEIVVIAPTQRAKDFRIKFLETLN